MNYYNEELMIDKYDRLIFKTTSSQYMKDDDAIVLNVSISKNEVTIRLERLWDTLTIPIDHEKFTVYPCEQSLQKLLQYYEKCGEIFKVTQVRESILENSLWELKNDYESLENLDKNGPPPMPDFHDNVGWQEANFEGYIDVMYEELDTVRGKLNKLYQQSLGTRLENSIKQFILKILKNNSKNWCRVEVSQLHLHKLQYLNLTV